LPLAIIGGAILVSSIVVIVVFAVFAKRRNETGKASFLGYYLATPNSHALNQRQNVRTANLERDNVETQNQEVANLENKK
jgi:hypothetical protein